MEKVFEEPRSEHGDGALGQSPLRPPSIVVGHPQLLQRPLLPQLVVDEPQPRPHRLAPSSSDHALVFPQALARRPDLPRYRVPQAPELLRYRPQGKRGVRLCRPEPGYRLERGLHCLHLVVVLPVPLLNLKMKLMIK